MLLRIEEKIPLKQGLKLIMRFDTFKPVLIEEKIPLKQGLKLCTYWAERNGENIEEKIPLKQGLKLADTLSTIIQRAELKRRFH